jgi:hypothetical protein
MMGGKGEAPMKAVDYAVGYLAPNLYFHLTTAYDILRSKGVPLGKADYLSTFVKVL